MTFLLRVETISEILQELKPVRRNGKTSLIRHRALPSVRKTPTGYVPAMSAFQSESKWPVIFMTANDDEDTRNEALDAGCIAYLRKPFAQDVLLNAISKAVA